MCFCHANRKSIEIDKGLALQGSGLALFRYTLSLGENFLTTFIRAHHLPSNFIMAFQFGFAADTGSDDDEVNESQEELLSATNEVPGVPAAAHSLKELVGI